MSYGPSLPPHLQKNSQPDSDSDDSDVPLGPALPPHLVKKRENKEEIVEQKGFNTVINMLNVFKTDLKTS